MKPLLLSLTLLITIPSISQQIMAEVGGTVISSYTPGFTGSLSLIFAKKEKPSGFGIGAEYFKSGDLPYGIPVFLRGVVVAKNGILVNLQAGYMFMQETGYDDGTKKIGGLWSKVGAGFQVKKLYGMVNLPVCQINDEVKAGIAFTIGIKL